MNKVKIITSWGCIWRIGNAQGPQIGCQVGFNGPDSYTDKELVIAKRYQRKLAR